MPPGRVFARPDPGGSRLTCTFPSPHLASRKIVFSQRFEWIAAAIMLGNSLLVGIEAEFTLNNLSSEQSWVIRMFDIAFNVCFTIELGLRLSATQLNLWLFSSVARIVRVVRFFNDLRVMVNGIKASSRALLWAVAPWPILATTRDLRLPRTILTLFMTISGGILWNEALRPLSEIHWVVDIIFLFYIFSTVSWCYHVTVCFVFKKTDETVVRQEWEKERRQWIADAAELFYKVDSDGAGPDGRDASCRCALVLKSIRIMTRPMLENTNFVNVLLQLSTMPSSMLCFVK
eukprot:Skav218363  [mRNA]  locus=scaffold2066:78289:86036:+ [translate_table: standard]